MIVCLLTIGDKSNQSEDIQDCKRFVKQIKADPNRGGTDDNDAGEREHQEGETKDDESGR